MKPTASHGAILSAMIKKDLRLYSRNKVYLFLTAVSLVFFVIIFWIIPAKEEETITLLLSPPLGKLAAENREALLALGATEEELERLDPADPVWQEEGLILVGLEDPEQVKSAIKGELEIYLTEGGGLILRDPGSGQEKPSGGRLLDPGIGIAFPDSFITDAAAGKKTTVTLFSDAVVPEEVRYAMQGLVREVAFQLAGRDLPVELPDEETIILGPDRLGDPVPFRDKLRPLIAFFVLLTETFAMASLISSEVLQRTVTALLVTPMRPWHFLAAKTIFGTGLALALGVGVLALVGTFTVSNWLLVVTTMLLGSALFTAVAMIIGAAGKEFVDQLMYAMLFTVPLMIPAFSVLFPGTAAPWVRFIPSFPIIHLLVEATIYDAGWLESLGALGYGLLWVVILYGVGLLVLKRKVALL